MSYVPSTKNFPDIFKNIPQAVTHPTGIAVLASVAIHVVLGVSLPYLSKTSSQEKTPSKRNVQLVKLTPEELGRVAQQAPATPLSIPTQIQQLAPLPGAPSTPFPPLNFNSSSSGNAALFNLPSNIAPPPTNQLANSSPSLSPNVKTSPSPNAKTSPSPNAKTSPSPTTKPTVKVNGTNSDPPVDRVENFTSKSIFSRPDQGNIPSTVAPTTPLPPPPPPSFTNPSVVRGGNLSGPQTMQPEFSNSNSNSPVAANPSSKAAALQGTPLTATSGENSVPLSSLPSREQAAQQLKQQISPQGDNLRPNSTNTTNEEARNNYLAYMSKANQVQAGERTIAASYPQEACSQQKEGASVVMVTVGADGRASSPQLIKSSGYGLFDERAIALAQASSFENSTGQSKPYKVSVDFKYDKAFCPSATTPQNSDKPQESAKPQNTTESKKPSEALSTPEPKKSPESAITNDSKKLPEPPNIPAPKK